MDVRCIIAAAGAVGINALAASAMIGLSAAEPVSDRRVAPIAVRLLPPLEPAARPSTPDAVVAAPGRDESTGAAPATVLGAGAGVRSRPAGGPQRPTPQDATHVAARTSPVSAPQAVAAPSAAATPAMSEASAVAFQEIPAAAVTPWQAVYAAAAAPQSAPSVPPPPPASITTEVPDAPPAIAARHTTRVDPLATTGGTSGGTAIAAAGLSGPLRPGPAGGERRTGPRIDASWAGNAAPPYPASARRLGEQGEVRLDVHVGPDGGVLDVRLRASSGSPTLDRSAIDAVRGWRFTPATVDGRAIAEWYHDWRWVFRLEG